MFLLSFISLGYFPSASMALEEVKLHTSGSGSPFPLIYNVSQDKGFYRDEGLDVLAISANLLTGIQGLAAGSFDFSQVLGQGSAAIFCAAFR
jgi:ABC-type nitrate/sulfonate/bicarbonate transport system substrate-binding protein